MSIAMRTVAFAAATPKWSRFARVHSCVAAVDTIYAVSSGLGRAGVTVIRISGADARRCIEEMCPGVNPPAPRKASLRKLFRPRSPELLDVGLVLYFPGPRSFTGEDIAELHVHGSSAVVQSVLRAVSDVEPQSSTRIRAAERGEFTRRAFENGRMDLTEAEGLADLIASESTEQRRQALRQMGGELRRLYDRWREELKSCLAYAEAVIDFGEDVDDTALDDVLPRAERARDEIRKHLGDSRRGEIVRSGVRLAIVGPPNAGKSSLLNQLARRPAAIVSPVEGTTRDVVQVNLELAGLSVVVSDTAGIREDTDDEVEKEGIRRAWLEASEADVVVCVFDASRDDGNFDWLRQEGIDGKATVLVANKVDLCRPDVVQVLTDKLPVPALVKGVSCQTGEGIDFLLEGLESLLQERVLGDGPDRQAPVITRERHRAHLQACAGALDTFLERCEAAGGDLPLDIATEELRVATRELGLITGLVGVEEVLDLVFQEFCIGKSHFRVAIGIPTGADQF